MAGKSRFSIKPTNAAEICVELYYKTLQNDPKIAHLFFMDDSTMCRIDGDMKFTATTMLKIEELVATLNYTHIEINTKHSIESWNDGVLVMVFGSVHIKDFTGQKMFLETFFVAPQKKGYYVLTDLFQYVDEEHIMHLLPLAHRNLDAESNSSNTVQQEDEVAQEDPALTAPEEEPPPVEEVASDVLPAADISGGNKILYCGNLPYDYDSARLAGIIQEHANPQLIKFGYNIEGHSKGFAFVTMSSIAECNRVIEKLDGKVYDGRALRIRFKDALPKNNRETPYTLFVGNLNWTVTSEIIRREFQAYGNVVGAKVLHDAKTGKYHSYGFVSYEKRAEMEEAFEALHGMKLRGRAMHLSMRN